MKWFSYFINGWYGVEMVASSCSFSVHVLAVKSLELDGFSLLLRSSICQSLESLIFVICSSLYDYLFMIVEHVCNSSRLRCLVSVRYFGWVMIPSIFFEVGY